jgi:hypothetical protein
MSTKGTTAAECQDRIALHLAQCDGWVRGCDLYAWMRDELGLSKGQGQVDLKRLVADGRIERADDVGTLNAYGGKWAKKFRSARGAA